MYLHQSILLVRCVKLQRWHLDWTLQVINMAICSPWCGCSFRVCLIRMNNVHKSHEAVAAIYTTPTHTWHVYTVCLLIVTKLVTDVEQIQRSSEHFNSFFTCFSFLSFSFPSSASPITLLLFSLPYPPISPPQRQNAPDMPKLLCLLM